MTWPQLDIASVIIVIGSMALALWIMAFVHWIAARHDRTPPEDDDPYEDWRGDDPGHPWDGDR